MQDDASAAAPGTDDPAAVLDELPALVEELHRAVETVVVGQASTVDAMLYALLSSGPLPAGGRARAGQDAARARARAAARPPLRAHPVHARPHALRHHGHRDPGGGPRPPATAASCSRAGPVFTSVLLADEINRTPPKTQAALLEAMQEKTVTRRGQGAPARRAVHRARHPEPDRAGGHLPAARGAARPLPVRAAARLPERRRTSTAWSTQHSFAPTERPDAAARRGADPRAARRGRARPRRAERRRLRGAPRARDAARRRRARRPTT